MNKTELCALFEEYGVDKCQSINHSYSAHYNNILSPYKSLYRNILEIGIGNVNLMRPIVGSTYQCGSSLRAWSKYFAQATIIGIDIDSSTLFSGPNIITYLVDQSSEKSIQNFLQNIEDEHGINNFDLIIDDGSHNPKHIMTSLNTLKNSLSNIGIYIIEDIKKNNIDDMVAYANKINMKIEQKYVGFAHDDCFLAIRGS